MAARPLFVAHPSDILPAEVEIYPSEHEERRLSVFLPGLERRVPGSSRCHRSPADSTSHVWNNVSSRNDATDKRVFKDGSVGSVTFERVAGG